MEQKPRRGGLVWPVILIGLGIVFLLNNLGMLSWDVWETILRMWPVILIAIGLDLIIGRRSVWGSLFALVLILAVLGGGVLLAQMNAGGAVADTTETVQYALGSATTASVNISPAVGDLRVRALPASSGDLAQGTIELVRGESLQRLFTGGAAPRLTLTTSKKSWGPMLGWKNARMWSLGLNPNAALDLELDMAVGKVDADLTGLSLESLRANLAVGQITVRLPAEGRYQARVSAAIGELVIEIPSGVGARVKAGAALAGRSFPSGYHREGDYYVSPNYSTAQHRVDLDANLAIGNLVVREAR